MPRDRLLTRSFVLASLANLFQGMAFFLFIHFPGFLQDLGADEVQIGIIVGIAAIASIAVRPWIGAAMDRRGRRIVILTGNVVNIVAILLYLTVTDLGPWLYFVRITQGIGQALLFTSLFTYGADVVPASRRTEGLALFGVSGLLPIALGGLLGDIVLSLGGFRELFLTSVVMAALAMAFSLPLRDQLPEPIEGQLRRGFLAAVTQRELLPLWFMVGSFSLVLTGYFTFLKTFVDETGIGSVGLFFGTYAATAIALRVFFAWVPARIGEKRALYPSFGALVAGFLFLATAGSGTSIAIAGVLCGAGHGYAFPILFGFVISRAPASDRGSAMAFFTALFDIGTLIGGPALGAVIAAAGYPTMYAVAAIALAGAVVVYASWDRRFDRAPADAAASIT